MLFSDTCTQQWFASVNCFLTDRPLLFGLPTCSKTQSNRCSPHLVLQKPFTVCLTTANRSLPALTLPAHVLTWVAESEPLGRVGLPIKRQLFKDKCFAHVSGMAMGHSHVGLSVSPMLESLNNYQIDCRDVPYRRSRLTVETFQQLFDGLSWNLEHTCVSHHQVEIGIPPVLFTETVNDHVPDDTPISLSFILC